MEQTRFNWVSTVLSVIAIAISVVALRLSWSQHDTDYARAVVIQPGALPIANFSEGLNSIELELSNTSKTNLSYFLRIDTNMGCLNGNNPRDRFVPCGYESQIISLSKTDAGKSVYKHTVTLNAKAGAADTTALSYMSSPDYFLRVEAVDANDRRVLFRSECFYAYHVEARQFRIDQPVIDTSGASQRKQASCRP